MASGYGFQFYGDCLGAIVPHGCDMRAWPSRPIHPFDVVCIGLKQVEGPLAEYVNAIGDAGFLGIVRMFLGVREVDGKTFYLVGQLNPASMFPLPADAVEAMHHVFDISTGIPPQGSDAAAVAMLARFAGDGPIDPVNPGWVPHWPVMGCNAGDFT